MLPSDICFCPVRDDRGLLSVGSFLKPYRSVRCDTSIHCTHTHTTSGLWRISSSPHLLASPTTIESLEPHERGERLNQASPASLGDRSNHLPRSPSGTVHNTMHQNQHVNQGGGREQMSKPSLFETASSSPTSSILSTTLHRPLDSPQQRGGNGALAISSPKQQCTGRTAMVHHQQDSKSPRAAIVMHGSSLSSPTLLESDGIRVNGGGGGGGEEGHSQQPTLAHGDGGIRVYANHGPSTYLYVAPDGIRVYSHVAPASCVPDNDGIRVRGCEEQSAISIGQRPTPPPPQPPPLPIDPLTGLQHGHPAMQPLQAPPLRRKKTAPKTTSETQLDTGCCSAPQVTSTEKVVVAPHSPARPDAPTAGSTPKKGMFRKLAGLVRSKSRDAKAVSKSKAPNELSTTVDSIIAAEEIKASSNVTADAATNVAAATTSTANQLLPNAVVVAMEEDIGSTNMLVVLLLLLLLAAAGSGGTWAYPRKSGDESAAATMVATTDSHIIMTQQQQPHPVTNVDDDDFMVVVVVVVVSLSRAKRCGGLRLCPTRRFP
jgi:hypothetical protein